MHRADKRIRGGWAVTLKSAMNAQPSLVLVVHGLPYNVFGRLICEAEPYRSVIDALRAAASDGWSEREFA